VFEHRHVGRQGLDAVVAVAVHRRAA
jgi:hypothetical protein